MREIQCGDCRVTLGTISVPSGSALKEKAAGSFIADWLPMLPADLSEVLVDVITYRCPTCTQKEKENGITQEVPIIEAGKQEGKQEGWSPFRRRRGDK